MTICGCLCGEVDAYDVMLPSWMVWSDHPIRQQYDVVMDLGEGSFAQVVLGRQKENHAKFAALKVVFLGNPELEADHLKIMRNEAEFLLKLHHSSIVECFDVVENDKQMVLVMEYLRGGALLDDLHHIAGEYYTEQQAAIIATQILEAVAYLHENGIIHRDVKPENIMFALSIQINVEIEDPQQAYNVKLIDLGMSAYFDPDIPTKGALGSPGFISPEIIIGEPHTYAMDVFAVGVVLFVLLVGRKPFNIADSESLSYCAMQLADCPGIQDPRWKSLSVEAQELVMGLLNYDPNKRLTAQQALQTDWIVTRGGKMPRPLDPNVARGAANVAAARRLRNMVHGAVALEPESPTASQRGPQEHVQHYKRRHTAQAQAAQQSRGYRDNPSKTGLSRVDSMALAANAASMARMHDSGRTVDPSRDISHHYRPHKGYSGSHHGGNLYAEVGGSLHSQHSGGRQSAGGSTHRKKNMPRNYSEGALARTQSSSHNQKSWQALAGGVKDYLDSSVRSGRAYKGSDRSARSGSRFYDDSSSRSGKAYYADTSTRSGRGYPLDGSAHAGKVYEPIPEYTGRPSQDLYVTGSNTPQIVDRPVTVADLQRQVQSSRSLTGSGKVGQSNAPSPPTSSKRVHKLTPL